MKKRTYKRLQNRLYREIKRRLILEQILERTRPLKAEIFKSYQQHIDTIKIKRDVPLEIIEKNKEALAYFKEELAQTMSRQLLADGYISFNTEVLNYNSGPIFEIAALLNVIKQKD